MFTDAYNEHGLCGLVIITDESNQRRVRVARICMDVQMYVCVCVRKYFVCKLIMYACMYFCMYVCMYVYIYIYIYILCTRIIYKDAYKKHTCMYKNMIVHVLFTRIRTNGTCACISTRIQYVSIYIYIQCTRIIYTNTYKKHTCMYKNMIVHVLFTRIHTNGTCACISTRI